jgi:cytoskeletal protein RodZ
LKIIEDIINQRKKLKLTFSDITKSIYIKEKILKDIEKSKFDRFANQIYLYGYIIKYLEFLQLNPNEYREELDDIVKLEKLKLKSPENIVEESNSEPNKPNILLPLIIILSIIILSFILFILISRNEIEEIDIIEAAEETIVSEEVSSNLILILSESDIEFKHNLDSDTFNEPVNLSAGETHPIIFHSDITLSITNYLNSRIFLNEEEIDLKELPEKEEIIINFSLDEDEILNWRLLQN